MTAAIRLKAAGRLIPVTLSSLGNVAIEPAEVRRADDIQCLHPDAPDREIAESNIDTLVDVLGDVFTETECHVIREMHQRMQRAIGRGSWPGGKQCHPALYPHDNYHATTLYIEHEGFLRNSSLNREVSDDEWRSVVLDARVWPSVEKPVQSVEECKRTFVYGGERVASFDRLEWKERSTRVNGQPYTVFDLSTWLVLEATRRVGCLFIEVFTGDEGRHNIHEKMIPIPGSTAGYAYFNNGTCNDHVTSNIDSLLTYSLGRICGLRCHEFGHNLNLQHEFRSPQSSHRSVMSYDQDNTPFQGYRLSEPPYWVNRPGNGVEDHSWPELRRFFGGEAARPITEPDEPDDPDDPDKPDKPTVLARFKSTAVGQEFQVISGKPTNGWRI